MFEPRDLLRTPHHTSIFERDAIQPVFPQPFRLLRQNARQGLLTGGKQHLAIAHGCVRVDGEAEPLQLADRLVLDQQRAVVLQRDREQRRVVSKMLH